MTIPQAPLVTPPPVDQNAEHLRLLSVFHYVVAGFTGLFSLFPLIHLGLGIAMVTHQFPPTTGAHPEDFPAFFGWFFILFAGIFILCGLTLTVLLVLAARRLAERTHYTFCFVVACIAMVMMPFGTLLGVFTVVVLSREPVKAMFAERAAQPG